METLINSLIENVNAHIDFGYLLTFIFSSYGVTKLIAGWKTTHKNIKKYSVFIWGTFLAVFWVSIFKSEPTKLLVTYSFGTSMYELLIKAVLNYFKPKS